MAEASRIRIDGRLHAVSQGAGAPVVLSHALGLDLTMWDDYAMHLASRAGAQRIPGATMTVFEDASHLSVIEAPRLFVDAVDGFLATFHPLGAVARVFANGMPRAGG